MFCKFFQVISAIDSQAAHWTVVEEAVVEEAVVVEVAAASHRR